MVSWMKLERAFHHEKCSRQGVVGDLFDHLSIESR